MGSIHSCNLLCFIGCILSIICNLLYLVFGLFLCGNLTNILTATFVHMARTEGFLAGLCLCSGRVQVRACYRALST